MAEESSGTEQSTKNVLSDRRTLKGIIVRPVKQIRYAFLFVGGGMLMLTGFIAVTLYYIRQTIFSLEIAYRLDREITGALIDSLTGMLTLAFVVAAIFSVLSIVLGMQMSHRYYGPIIPLLRHVEELRNGNYSSRVKLRQSDELIEIQDALNGLAETLDERKPAAGAQNNAQKA